jgi:hypothetical protein
MKQFKTRLTARGPGGAWTFLEIPFSVEKEFGSKARIAVAGTMNGFPFQNSPVQAIWSPYPWLQIDQSAWLQFRLS